MAPSNPLQAEPATVGDGVGVPDRRWWGYAVGVPLGLYVLTRIVQLTLVVLMADPDGPPLADRLMVWDAGFFVRVAEHGYEHGYSYNAEGEFIGNGLAFFPLYPLLIRVVSWLPWLTPSGAALVVSGVAGAGGAVLLSILGSRLYNRQTGYALAVLFGAQPMSVVLSMGYTEALFAALVVATLVAIHHNAWLIGGFLGLLAGLTRPTGLALAGALLIAAAWYLWRNRMPRHYPSWRIAVGALLAFAGTPLYVLWVGLRVGELDAWFTMEERGWGTRWDYGTSTAHFLADTFSDAKGWVEVSTAVIIVGVGLAVLVALSERVWLPLSLYGLFAFMMAVGSSGYFHSRARMLVPELLYLIPLGIALGRCRPRTAAIVLVGATLLGCWYGAYMLTVWPFTI
jgi:hypothetical protein